ncbi:MAG: ATP synthase subunit I [Gammaproteobacteria bacterium]|nr:ATP synthase subunit I [Gammaproteobacteria bacterium]
MSRFVTLKDVSRIVYLQFVLMAIAAFITFLLVDKQAGLSVFLGALACWVPTFLFARLVFADGYSARVFLTLFVVGEALRLFLSATLFVLVVKYLPVRVLPVFAGFAGTLFAFWLASLFLLIKKKG